MRCAVPAAAVEPRVSRRTSVSRSSLRAAHEAIEGLLVRFGAPVAIVEAFSTTPRKKNKNKCSLQPLVVINTAMFAEVLEFVMPVGFSNHLPIVLFHSG